MKFFVAENDEISIELDKNYIISLFGYVLMLQFHRRYYSIDIEFFMQ